MKGFYFTMKTTEKKSRVTTFVHMPEYQKDTVSTLAGKISIYQLQSYQIIGLSNKNENAKSHPMMRIPRNISTGFGKFLATAYGMNGSTPKYKSYQEFIKSCELNKTIENFPGKLICISEIGATGLTSEREPDYVDSDGTKRHGKYKKNYIENISDCYLRSVTLCRIGSIKTAFVPMVDEAIKNPVMKIPVKDNMYPDFSEAIKRADEIVASLYEEKSTVVMTDEPFNAVLSVENIGKHHENVINDIAAAM